MAMNFKSVKLKHLMWKLNPFIQYFLIYLLLLFLTNLSTLSPFKSHPWPFPSNSIAHFLFSNFSSISHHEIVPATPHVFQSIEIKCFSFLPKPKWESTSSDRNNWKLSSLSVLCNWLYLSCVCESYNFLN